MFGTTGDCKLYVNGQLMGKQTVRFPSISGLLTQCIFGSAVLDAKQAKRMNPDFCGQVGGSCACVLFMVLFFFFFFFFLWGFVLFLFS